MSVVDNEVKKQCLLKIILNRTPPPQKKKLDTFVALQFLQKLVLFYKYIAFIATRHYIYKNFCPKWLFQQLTSTLPEQGHLRVPL